jgi:hypothetical protein
MATLYEMTGIAAQLYALFEADEIDEQTVMDTLEGIGVEGKLEDYCKVIRQLESDAVAYKTEKLRFAEKQSRAEKSVERMKTAILTYLEVIGSTGEKVGAFDIKLRKSENVVIDDVYKLDEHFVTYQEPKPDKTAIKKAIKSGVEVNGAHIEERNNLNIK